MRMDSWPVATMEGDQQHSERFERATTIQSSLQLKNSKHFHCPNLNQALSDLALVMKCLSFVRYIAESSYILIAARLKVTGASEAFFEWNWLDLLLSKWIMGCVYK